MPRRRESWTMRRRSRRTTASVQNGSRRSKSTSYIACSPNQSLLYLRGLREWQRQAQEGAIEPVHESETSPCCICEDSESGHGKPNKEPFSQFISLFPKPVLAGEDSKSGHGKPKKEPFSQFISLFPKPVLAGEDSKSGKGKPEKEPLS